MAAFTSFDQVPRHQYKVILADPNWQFDTFSDKGKGKSPDNHYNCDPTEIVMAHPVKDLIHPDGAVLFLWVTWPKIFHAERVINAWGFQYSGLAWEWIKYNPVSKKFAFGNGYVTRKNVEPCLLGVTKNFKTKRELKNQSTRDFLFARKREHSQKPDEQYARIESLFDGPYLELFARQEWPGWDAMGDQVYKFTPEEVSQIELQQIQPSF